MSAIVCGKRSFFEDLPTIPPVAKRIRCSSSSPVRLSPPRPINATASASPLSPPPPSSLSDQSHDNTAALAHLSALFPNMEKFLERALEECGGDLDSAIKRLNGLCLGSVEGNLASGVDKTDITSQDGGRLSSEDPSSADLPKEGSEWVELFVREMMNASNLDDARTRAARVLEFLEKSIRNHVDAEVAQNFQKENMMLKEQMEGLLQENTILKRAVAIQHERQKEYEDKNHEWQHLKQLVAQYQEQLRILEVNNYALMMHLKQARQSNCIPGRFHPDIF